jgi:hypothetical protein
MKVIKMRRNREHPALGTLEGDRKYTLPDQLADLFLSDGHAVLIAVVPDPEPEEKPAEGEEHDAVTDDDDPQSPPPPEAVTELAQPEPEKPKEENSQPEAEEPKAEESQKPAAGETPQDK